MNRALMTDLYQISMAAAYFESGQKRRGIFELFIRTLPKNRGCLIAAGLEQALEYLETLRFETDEIRYLRQLPNFQDVPDRFFQFLARLRFTGNVRAVPEGTAVFANEPLLSVNAPIIEAQIAETYLLSAVLFQTMVASKAARIVDAAQNRPVADFGTRRAHGPEAGALAARAAYIGGCAGTSNVYAGKTYGVPVFGTMAHSFVLASRSERRAFESFLRAFPNNASLLVDTYDIRKGIENALRMGPSVRSVRIDSGDLERESRNARRQLDENGRPDIQIIASGDLNEYRVQRLVQNGAPIDIFGVGTDMVVSRDAPALPGVYKLAAYEEENGRRIPTAKSSAGKETYPHPKQVFRQSGPGGVFAGDLIARQDETHDGEPLLIPVMKDGRRIAPAESLEAARNRAESQRERLPERIKRLENPDEYAVRFSKTLQEERRKTESARRSEAL